MFFGFKSRVTAAIYRFPLYSRGDDAGKLTRLEIPTKPSDLIDSTLVLIRYLQQVIPGAKVSSWENSSENKSNGLRAPMFDC